MCFKNKEKVNKKERKKGEGENERVRKVGMERNGGVSPLFSEFK